MSVQAAMDFIRQVQEQRQSGQATLIDSCVNDIHAVVQTGARMGYDFTVDDLRAAFRHNWQMRWLRAGVAQG